MYKQSFMHCAHFHHPQLYWTCWMFDSWVPPALWPVRCSHGRSSSLHCNKSAYCTLPPCRYSCTCIAFWTQHGTSETWGCRWWGWWRCWCRCTSCRRGGTRCRGKEGWWRSWPPPMFGKASTAMQIGSPPQPASLLSVEGAQREKLTPPSVVAHGRSYWARFC